MGDVNSGVVASVWRVCVQSWPVVGVGGFHRRWLLFAGSLCPLHVLLPLLGGCGVMLGDRCHSWMPGTVRPGGGYRTLHGSDVVVRQMRVVPTPTNSGVCRCTGEPQNEDEDDEDEGEGKDEDNDRQHAEQ